MSNVSSLSISTDDMAKFIYNKAAWNFVPDLINEMQKTLNMSGTKTFEIKPNALILEIEGSKVLPTDPEFDRIIHFRIAALVNGNWTSIAECQASDMDSAEGKVTITYTVNNLSLELLTDLQVGLGFFKNTLLKSVDSVDFKEVIVDFLSQTTDQDVAYEMFNFDTQNQYNGKILFHGTVVSESFLDEKYIDGVNGSMLRLVKSELIAD